NVDGGIVQGNIGAAVAAYGAADGEFAARRDGNSPLGQHGPDRMAGGWGEQPGEARFVRSLTDGIRLEVIAEDQPHGIEQDGFSRPGIAGQDGQSRMQVEIEMIDNDELVDNKFFEHESGGY